MSLPVSVLIPTYNRAELIAETLESILSQTYAPHEVIVVDDGSTDGTGEVVRGFGSRVHYRFVDNGGVCRARNIAASLASSPFLAFCDSDDLWRKDKLELQMSLHARHPALGFSFTNFAFVEAGKWSARTKFDDAPKGYFNLCSRDVDGFLVCEKSMYSQVLKFQPIFQSTHVMTKKLFDDIGGYKESLGRVLSEDLEFTLRCVQAGPVGIVQAPVVGIRKHGGNISGNTYATTEGETKILRHALEYHSLSSGERDEIMHQVYLRHVELAYEAFRRGHFKTVVALLEDVPSSYLGLKDRARQLISRFPPGIASRLQRAL